MKTTAFYNAETQSRRERLFSLRLCASAFIILSVSARAQEPVAEILTVRGSVIYPTNVAAEVSAVAAAVAKAEAAAAQAEAVETAAAMVSNAVAGVNEIVNNLEGIGYIRGHVMQFGSGIEANTNAVASIVKLAPAGTSGTNSLWDIWTYFTEDPGVLPVIRFTDSLGRTNAWDEATAVGEPVIDTVLVGSTEYEAYKNRVSLPPKYGSAFFRTFVNVSGVGTNAVYLPVRNGVAVNGTVPLTATFVDGTNTYSFVGGVRVQ
jgi:hypothetical protein